MAQVIAVLQEGLNSPERAEFVKSLSARCGRGDRSFPSSSYVRESNRSLDMVVQTSPTEKLNKSQALERGLPPLCNGDRLTRPEFERRYAAMPHLKKAELIERVVYITSAVSFEAHAQPHAWIITWLGIYCAATAGARLGTNPTVRLDMDNEPQPDGVLLLDPRAGGQSRLGDDGYIEDAPELVAEVAASSAAYDLHDKKRVYRRNGVREYIVWQTFENKLDWFGLSEGKYFALEPDESGVVRSVVFPGLWLAVPALLELDFAGVLAVLQEGLNSPEQAEFVKRLSAKLG